MNPGREGWVSGILSARLKDDCEFAEMIRLKMVFQGEEQHVHRPTGMKQHSRFVIWCIQESKVGAVATELRGRQGLGLRGPYKLF